MSRWALLLCLILSIALAACAGILGIRGRSNPGGAPFEHRAHVLKGVACVQCHQGILSATDTGKLHVPGSDQCRTCHSKPHDERACEGCHGSSATREHAALTKKHIRFSHRDHSGPGSGQCVRCHVQVAEERPVSLLPPMAACFKCHDGKPDERGKSGGGESRHAKQFATRTCEACHVDLPAERVVPESHVAHQGDFVREHGVRAAAARDLCATCHSERFCTGCHGVNAPILPWRLAFDEPRLSGLHRAGFRSRHAEEARAQPGLCVTCHSEGSCRGCHEAERTSASVSGSRNPHPRGWLLPGRGGGDHGVAARLDPAGCASCHGGAGEQLCVGCHRVGGPGGNPHGPGFQSTRDKTRDQPCRMCHTP